MIRTLPATGSPAADAPAPYAADHPMRKVTRAVAADVAAWDAQTARTVADTFDGLAADWPGRLRPDRFDGLTDAFDRGLAFDAQPSGTAVVPRVCLELGSGTGFATPWLAARFPVMLAVDLSARMLALAPADAGHRVQADGARLPLRDGSVDVAVLVNALLFGSELDRVLAPDGALVWVNKSGPATPIHLPAEDVEAALPGAWDGVASQAGRATWAVLRRAAA